MDSYYFFVFLLILRSSSSFPMIFRVPLWIPKNSNGFLVAFLVIPMDYQEFQKKPEAFQSNSKVFPWKTIFSKGKPSCSKENQKGVGAEMCYVSIRNPYGIHTDLCVPRGFGSSSEAGPQSLLGFPRSSSRDSCEALGPPGRHYSANETSKTTSRGHFLI